MKASTDPHRDQRWAWGFVVLSVAAAIAGQIVGVLVARLLGYSDPDTAPPLGAALLITLPALLISITPPLAALYFGVRAGVGGRPGGYLAAVLAGLIIVFWSVVTMMLLINRA